MSSYEFMAIVLVLTGLIVVMGFVLWMYVSFDKQISELRAQVRKLERRGTGRNSRSAAQPPTSTMFVVKKKEEDNGR